MKINCNRTRDRLSAVAAATRPFTQSCARHLGVLGVFVAVGTVMATSAIGQSPPVSLVESFEAIPDTGWIPCDPIIAAGPDSLVTMVQLRDRDLHQKRHQDL